MPFNLRIRVEGGYRREAGTRWRRCGTAATWRPTRNLLDVNSCDPGLRSQPKNQLENWKPTNRVPTLKYNGRRSYLRPRALMVCRQNAGDSCVGEANRPVCSDSPELHHDVDVPPGVPHTSRIWRCMGSEHRKDPRAGERHLRRILKSYLDYYHRSRTHLALSKDAPEPRSVQPPGIGEIVELPQVGGLHHRYVRELAQIT